MELYSVMVASTAPILFNPQVILLFSFLIIRFYCSRISHQKPERLRLTVSSHPVYSSQWIVINEFRMTVNQINESWEISWTAHSRQRQWTIHWSDPYWEESLYPFSYPLKTIPSHSFQLSSSISINHSLESYPWRVNHLIDSLPSNLTLLRVPHPNLVT